nr:KilA-N domain-containing protein [Burkholderia sp. WAC0059]
MIQRQPGRGGGTWLYPKLAVAFARRCSPEFQRGSVWPPPLP